MGSDPEFRVEKKIQNGGKGAMVLSWFSLLIRHLQSLISTWRFLAEWARKLLTAIHATLVNSYCDRSDSCDSPITSKKLRKSCFIVSASTLNH